MKATVNTKDLIKALAQVNRVNSRRVTLPVLTSILMDFSNNKLTLASTNLECAVRVGIKCEADAPFGLVLSKSLVSKFVRPNSPTTLFTTGKDVPNPVSVIEQQGVGKMNIFGAKPTDFPPLPVIPDPTDWLTVDAKWFCRMLGILLTSCAKEENRPVLTGIAFNDGAMATADGFRLVVVKSDRLKFGALPKDGIIIPHTTAFVAQKLFEKEESIQIAAEPMKHLIHFVSKDTSLTSQLIQGSFPQYEQLIPLSFTSRLSVSAPLMVQRLDMMDTSMGSGIVKMFVQEEGVLTIVHNDPEFMDYEMTIPAKTDHEQFKIAMQYKYLMDAIKPFSLCTLEMSNASSPLKVTGDIEELMVIIMPMFIQW